MTIFSETITKIQTWSKSHGALIGLLGLLSGAGLGIAIPIWQTYWVETPRLRVEIYAIDRSVLADARISPDDDALSILGGGGSSANFFGESTALLRALETQGARAIRQGGFTSSELTERLNAAKAELKVLPQRVEERQRQLRDAESLLPERILIADVARLNAPIPGSREFKATQSFNGTDPKDLEERKRAIEHFKAEYRKRLDDSQKRYTELQTQLPLTERRIAELKQDLDDRKGYFQITAILNNSGRKSISIRQLGLLRVYIGKGNYVDLKLNLQKYQESAEVAPNGTRIATFHSDALEAFEDADRTLIKNYWGQSVQGVLFVEDISGAIHSSASISFAKGLYIKEVFNRLTSEASKPIYQGARE